MRASRFEYVQAAIAIPLIAWNMGDATTGFLGFMLGMALGAPFGCLNALCRFEWAVLWLALWVFPLGFAIIGVSAYAGFLTNQAVGLATFAMLALVYHHLIVRQIPYYFQKAVERI